jgi:GDP-4-dehydro-6-deoxy-D-mannose reductase
VRALVTGAGGFAGRHLVRRLLGCGWEVTGTALTEQEMADAECPMIRCDVTEAAAVEAAVEQARPQAVIHLAAVAFVPDARRNPGLAFRVNVLGTQHLLESVQSHAPRATVAVVSSAAVYGAVPSAAQPIREDQPVAPADVYAVTKAAVEALARACAERVRVIILRPFNHIGPGQSAEYVASSFARQIAEAEAGLAEPVLRVGDLEARRDFTDVRDVAEAYRLAVERCRPNTPYNICSGRAVAIGELLERLVAQSRCPVRVEQDPDRMRPSDVPLLHGSPERFASETGWRPQLDLEQTLTAVLEDWRERLRRGRERPAQ